MNDPPPSAISSADVEAFLSSLAVAEDVSASTQDQAFNALLFLRRHVLYRALADVAGTVRARQKRRLPVVLSRMEVHRVLARLPDRYALMARLVYGAGLLPKNRPRSVPAVSLK